MSKSAVFTMKMDADLKRRIEAAAAADQRSTASLISVVMTRWLEGNGYEVDPAMIKPLPVPGRPRLVRDHGNTKHYLSPAVVPWLGEKTQVTLTQVLEGALKTSLEDCQPGLIPAIKALFVELGWQETFVHSGNGTTEPAWLKH